MFVRGTLLNCSFFRVSDFKKVRNPLRTCSVGAEELLLNFCKAFAHELVPNVRAKCLGEGRDTARVSAHAIIDVVGVLLLEAVGEGHSFHNEKWDDRGDTALDFEVPAARKFPFDRDHFVALEDEIAASGLSRAGILYDLRPM